MRLYRYLADIASSAIHRSPLPTFSTQTLRRGVGSITCFAWVGRSQTLRKCHLELDSSDRKIRMMLAYTKFAHDN
jgi:hypothetical protein